MLFMELFDSSHLDKDIKIVEIKVKSEFNASIFKESLLFSNYKFPKS